ncbi:hypothetical protein Pedsa_2449 [Pseudopedobacter saltans DSM 12145]|uniref:Uncharacterized protein n=1 Tax=Pseudopedobacter saltans (strain ATCC 51119 / DSM 12145 / JCM 21818 / CCUG 39354 / LMG 10337 / NBRC 100064 / NCIMB 13643) TaxID=762903 RepID=F0SES8_PSESL|nr:hypothetical protein [Pseudopedobacter saltans]ADY52994.1 hypothetical protein Pedsa_2449 [Pseudopedobacter saltans DSM 12145]
MKKKRTIFFIYGLLISFTVLSCGKIDSKAPYFYTLKIRFTDKDGNDKLQGIKYGERDKSEVNIFKVNQGSYQLGIVQTQSSKEDMNLLPLTLQRTEPYDCLVLTARTFTFVPPTDRSRQLTYKFVCAHIFGDEEEHTVVSDWGEVGSVLRECITITLDGKTFTAMDRDQFGYPVFHVLLGE